MSLKNLLDDAMERRRKEVGPMICPVCGKKMVLGEEFGKLYYFCEGFPKDCDVTLGAYPDGRPMGKPADASTRAARAATHGVLDPIWKDHYSGPLNPGTVRTMLYEWLRDKLGMIEFHIGNLNLETCKKVMAICMKAPKVEIIIKEVQAKRDDVARQKEKRLEVLGIYKPKTTDKCPSDEEMRKKRLRLRGIIVPD